MDARRLRAPLLAGFGLLLLPACAGAAIRYTLTDLGTLGGHDSAAYAINDSGQVAGFASGSGWSRRAVTWIGKVGAYLDVIPDSEAYGINDVGQIVGRSIGKGFVWDSVVGPRYLGGPGATPLEVRGINNNGQAVGWMVAGGFVQAFLWDDAHGIVGLSPSGGLWPTKAYAINDAGQVVGWGSNDAFLWDPTNGLRTLPTLSGRSGSGAYDISSFGDIVGYSDSTQGWRACIWDRNGVLQNLGVLPGFRYSYAYGINDLGQVVGYCTNSLSGEYDHSFVWTAESGMLDLNELALGVPRHYERACAINNNGQIVGHSAHADGHGFLLTPVPEPATMLTIIWGLASALAIRRRRV